MDSVGPRKGERVEGGGDEAGGRERELGGGAKKVRQQSAVTTTTAKGSLSCLVLDFSTGLMSSKLSCRQEGEKPS